MIPLLMAAAGGLGAGTRYALDLWVRARVTDRFPWSTLLINVIGSFALGLVIGLDADHTWRTILGTGFLGGYTTFSTASVETVRLALDGRRTTAAVNALAMLGLGVAAAAGGYLVGG